MHRSNYRRYQKHRKKATVKNILCILALFLVGAFIAYFNGKYMVDISSNSFSITLRQTEEQPQITPQDENNLYFEEENTTQEQQETTENSQVIERDDVVYNYLYNKKLDAPSAIIMSAFRSASCHIEEPARILYFDVNRTGDSAYIDTVFSRLSSGEFNRLAIPFKNANGSLNYNSKLNYKSVSEIYADVSAVVTKARENGIYIMGVVCAYTDNNFARKYTEAAIATTNNINWLDYSMQGHIDPFSDVGHKYLKEISNEIYAMGVKEILYTNMHFPLYGRLELIKYGNGTVSNAQIIADRLADFDTLGKASVLLSDVAFDTNNVSYEDISLMASSVNTIYVNATDTQDIANFNAIEVKNKSIITSNTEFITEEINNYIIK